MANGDSWLALLHAPCETLGLDHSLWHRWLLFAWNLEGVTIWMVPSLLRVLGGSREISTQVCSAQHLVSAQ